MRRGLSMPREEEGDTKGGGILCVCVCGWVGFGGVGGAGGGGGGKGSEDRMMFIMFKVRLGQVFRS